MPAVSSQAAEIATRAKTRQAEQRKLEHAQRTYLELLAKHSTDNDNLTHDHHTIHSITNRISVAIKNQHITDKRYAEYKALTPPPSGDY